MIPAGATVANKANEADRERPSTATLNVVTNWFEELKAKVGNQ